MTTEEEEKEEEEGQKKVAKVVDVKEAEIRDLVAPGACEGLFVQCENKM